MGETEFSCDHAEKLKRHGRKVALRHGESRERQVRASLGSGGEAMVTPPVAWLWECTTHKPVLSCQPPMPNAVSPVATRRRIKVLEHGFNNLRVPGE